jgi:hypothetical protein
VGHDLSVGWMIGGLDANDMRFEATLVRVHVAEEFELRRGRPDDEDGIDAVQGSRDLAEEASRVVWMLSRLSPPFRMSVHLMPRRQDGGLVRRVRMDVKNARFVVIDPDDCVRGHTSHHARSARVRAQRVSRRVQVSSHLRSTIHNQHVGAQSSTHERKPMKKQARNHVDPKLSESDGAPAMSTGATSAEFVTEMFEYDGRRQVTVYVPPAPPEAIVFAGEAGCSRRPLCRPR